VLLELPPRLRAMNKKSEAWAFAGVAAMLADVLRIGDV
jgi:hypothetical protein